mgnify:CR=1 FL=1
MNTNLNTDDGSMLLSIQMVADPLDEMLWDFTLEAAGDTPCLRCCQIYCGQTALRTDTLYLIPEGMGQGFPADTFRYAACEDICGAAPHIRALRRPIYEILNEIVSVFQRYHDFESQLNQIVTGGGTLVDLCRAGSAFFQNPVYIHDNMFSVIALSSKVEGMLKFEYNENTGKLYVPLWLINEFKYDENYQKTLECRTASIWDNEQYPYTMRSLYVNLFSNNVYCGRLLINEIGSPLQLGQYQAAEYLAKFAVKLIEQDEMDASRRYWGLEDTFIDLMNGASVDNRDLQTTLSILDWTPLDSYLCLKIRNQSEALSVRSDKALNNALASQIQGYFSFSYQKMLCVVINQTRPGMDQRAVRQILAPLVRDSCMYVGISNPVDNIHAICVGFRQADIALQYIVEENSSQWIVPFAECALHYIRGQASQEIPTEMLADHALLTILRYDKKHDTQYFGTLRSYLINERSIPKTANSLIIHRTTLTYRLQKIQELFNLNLEDDYQRLYLLMSLFLLDSGNYTG